LAFFVHTHRSRKQAKRTPGNLAVELRRTDGLAFWTMTLWWDVAARRSFVTASPHNQTMRKLAHWCDEAAFTHWHQENNELPTWDIAADKLRATGHLATVLHPSEEQEAGKIVIT
jgi:hypothetical protein